MLSNNEENLLYILANKNSNIAQLVKEDITNCRDELILNEIDKYINNIKDLANDKNNKSVCLLANKYLLNRMCDYLKTYGDKDLEDLEFIARLKKVKLNKKI